jgi:hypothetical protein
MFTGQILIYHYNDISNAKPNCKRNIYSLKSIKINTSLELQQAIEDCLDEVKPGKGYVLVNWQGKLHICEKDLNNPKHPYVNRKISYHPFMNVFDKK